MADNVGDINLNINVNVRGAAGITALNTALNTLAQKAAAVAAAQKKVAASVARTATQTTNQAKSAATAAAKMAAATTVAAQKAATAQQKAIDKTRAAQEKAAIAAGLATRKMMAAQDKAIAKAIAAQNKAAAAAGAATAKMSAAQNKAIAAAQRSAAAQIAAANRVAAANARTAARAQAAAQRTAAAQITAANRAAAAQTRAAAQVAAVQARAAAAQTRAVAQQAATAARTAATQQRAAAAAQVIANRQVAASQRIVAAKEKEAAALRTVKGRLDAAETSYDAIFRASYRLQNVGYGLISVARKVFDVITGLTDAWGKFEFTVHRAAGALQIWKEVGSDINPVYEALIQNIYRTTKELGLFPAEEVAKATYFWGSTTGQQVKTLADLEVVMRAVNPLMKIAAMTETSYETAIKGVYSILIQYHRGLGDAADVTHKLFLVTQRTALEFPDLINAFKFVGPVAGALGVSFEEVAKTLGAVGDAGIRGTMAGRALRQMFIQTVRPTEQARAKLEELFRSTQGLGKSFEEVVFPEGKFIGITAYTQKLAFALQNATTRQRQFLYASISTANELPLITALVENEIRVLRNAADAYDMTKTSVDDSAHAALQFNKAWDLLANSWKGIVGKLRAGAEVIRLKIGRNIAEGLTESVAAMTGLLSKVERWIDRNPTFVTGVGKFAASLGALAGVAGGLLILSGALLGLYAAINIIARGFGPILGIGLAAIGAFAAIAEAIVINWTYILRTIGPAIDSFWLALTGGKSTILILEEQWARLHEGIKAVANFVVTVAVKALKLLLDGMTAILNSPLRPFIDALGKALVTAFGARAIFAILGVTSAFRGLLVLLSGGLLSTALGLFFLPLTQGIKVVVAGFAILKGGFMTVVAVIRAGAIGTAIALGRLMIMTKIVAVLAIVRSGAILTALGLIRMSVASVLAGGGIRTLTTALVGLSRTSVLIVLTLIIAALQFLYDMDFLGIRSGFEGVSKSVEQLTDSMANFYFEVGAGGVKLKATIDALVDSATGYTSQLAALIVERDKLMQLGGLDRVANLGRLQDVEKQIGLLTLWSAEAADKWRASFQKIADDTEQSLIDVISLTTKWGPKIFGPLEIPANMIAAQKTVQGYFERTRDGVLSIQDAVQLWNETEIKPNMTLKAFVDLMVDPAQVTKEIADSFAKVDIAEAQSALRMGDMNLAANILVGLKAGSAGFSDSINAQVARLTEGIPKTLLAVTEEAQAIMLQAPAEILGAMVEGFKKLGNIKDRFAKAIKNKVHAKDIAEALIGDVTAVETTKGLQSLNASMRLWGQTVISDAHTSFVAAVAAHDATGTTDQLARKLEEAIGPGKVKQIFFKSFKGNWWKKLDTDQQAALQEMVDWLVSQPGHTPPSEGVLGEAAGKLKGLAAIAFYKEFGRAYGEPPAADNTGGGAVLPDPISEMLARGKTTWDGAGGKTWIENVALGIKDIINGIATDIETKPNFIDSLATGMRTAFYAEGGVKATADMIALAVSRLFIGQSPPPEGPLANIQTGGLNVIKAWALGFLLALPMVRVAAGLVGGFTKAHLSPPMLSLYGGGFNVLKSWVDGMADYWKYIGKQRMNIIVGQAADPTVGTSPPKTGPLKGIYKGGFNIMKAWGDGLALGGIYAVSRAETVANSVSAALKVDAGATTMAMSYARSDERTINVAVDVTSKDGSVDKTTTQQLAGALSSSEMVRALQHMASVKG